MKRKNKILTSILLIISTALTWRGGGSAKVHEYIKHNKLVRRIGSALCCMGIIALFTERDVIKYLGAYTLITISCVSYMGFLNYIVRLWWKEIEMSKEYWFNFLLEAMFMQSSMLLFDTSPRTIVLAVVFAVLSSFGKVAIDESKIRHKDVWSELYFGLVSALGIFINCLFI